MDTQIDVINKNIQLAANFLQRCPSCLANLVRHICDFTCSPNQSDFMMVRGIEEGENGKQYLKIFFVLWSNNEYNAYVNVQFDVRIESSLKIPLQNHFRNYTSTDFKFRLALNTMNNSITLSCKILKNRKKTFFVLMLYLNFE